MSGGFYFKVGNTERSPLFMFVLRLSAFYVIENDFGNFKSALLFLTDEVAADGAQRKFKFKRMMSAERKSRDFVISDVNGLMYFKCKITFSPATSRECRMQKANKQTVHHALPARFYCMMFGAQHDMMNDLRKGHREGKGIAANKLLIRTSAAWKDKSIQARFSLPCPTSSLVRAIYSRPHELIAPLSTTTTRTTMKEITKTAFPSSCPAEKSAQRFVFTFCRNAKFL